MKKYIVLVLSLVFLSISFNADAQRRGTKKRENRESTRSTVSVKNRDKKETKNFKDFLNPEFKLGSLGGGGNANLTALILSLKGNVGYKLHKHFSTGIGTKFSYQYNNYRYQDYSESTINIAAFAYGRIKFLDNIYIQGEYVIERFDNQGTFPAQTISYPTVGFGYLNLGDKWSFGPEMNFILSNDAIDRKNNIFEYWINMSYRF